MVIVIGEYEAPPDSSASRPRMSSRAQNDYRVGMPWPPDTSIKRNPTPEMRDSWIATGQEAEPNYNPCACLVLRTGPIAPVEGIAYFRVPSTLKPCFGCGESGECSVVTRSLQTGLTSDYRHFPLLTVDFPRVLLVGSDLLSNKQTEELFHLILADTSVLSGVESSVVTIERIRLGEKNIRWLVIRWWSGPSG
jgi:hypothetical protein